MNLWVKRQVDPNALVVGGRGRRSDASGLVDVLGKASRCYHGFSRGLRSIVSGFVYFLVKTPV